MKFCVAIIVSVVLFLVPIKGFSWGAAGHKIVAKIAYNQIGKSIKDSLTKYLGNMSIEDASVWMDEIRSDNSYDSLKPWHYINIDKGAHYSPDSFPNVVWAIQKMVNELKNRANLPKDRIEFDLKVLIHLMGDLHQPLHNGYGVDQGGNLVTVFYKGSSSNLHRIWDTDMVEDEIIGAPTTWADLSDISKEQMAEIKRYAVVEWMEQSRSYLPSAYDFNKDQIGQKYINRNVPIIQHQLLYGGLRLAGLLRSIFKGEKQL